MAALGRASPHVESHRVRSPQTEGAQTGRQGVRAISIRATWRGCGEVARRVQVIARGWVRTCETQSGGVSSVAA